MTTTGRPSLVRAMGRGALTAAVINGVIGSGIFGLPSVLVGLAGPWSPVLVLAAGACIFVIILCFAEVSSRFADAGGPYLYAREAFGATAAFHVGWLLLFTRLLSAAAALNILTVYLATLIPVVGTSAGRIGTMTVAVVSVTLINVRGVAWGARATNVFTIAKLVPLLILAGAGLMRWSPAVVATQAVAAPDWTTAVLLLVFAYGGFEGTTAAAGEARNPKRDSAIALVAATVIVTVVYALLQSVIVGVLPQAAATSTPIAAALSALFGPAGATLASAGAVVSVYGWWVGFTLMMPRVVYAMADRGELPPRLAFVHPAFRTPAPAIVAVAVAAWLMAVFSTFAQAATLAAIPRLGIFMVVCAALIALRRKADAPAAAFVVRGGPAFAVAGIIFSGWMLSTRSFDQVWLLLVVIGIGFAVRAFYAPARRSGVPGQLT
jgi:amino acid transporter